MCLSLQTKAMVLPLKRQTLWLTQDLMGYFNHFTQLEWLLFTTCRMPCSIIKLKLIWLKKSRQSFDLPKLSLKKSNKANHPNYSSLIHAQETPKIRKLQVSTL